MIFLALSLVDLFVQAEVSQAKGRPDAVVHTESAIYVLEFKLDQSAEVALEQIKTNHYAAPYLSQGKAMRAVGFNFSSEQKAISGKRGWSRVLIALSKRHISLRL